ncbi:MAG: aminotransferase class V-fold PLP-dependent enzyme [Alphaproteobacteria bacterium]|nr:aminotransferase class V-fold PLP-dependent enzyme [Alphaproteobacteria bacterium]MCB9693221.1 aminotransferase class V-fold PLP-dependent enzyme [Alphaproteobacteria bacterium]
MPSTPLLMIPGPIEISDAVFAATCVRPASHLAPGFKHAFAGALRKMRTVWRASADHHPFVVAGGGTLAMEAAATNLVDPGHTVLVVNTGVFGDRMVEMLRRRGANVLQVGAEPGHTVPLAEVRNALHEHRPHALFATHVDTSTGVRVDVAGLAGLAREVEALSIFDGVCATGAEVFEMASWGADVYLTASQKAIGLPAGLALWMASPRALEARRALNSPPPMTLDWLAWLPILEAYGREDDAYFSTPPTTLIPALDVSLGELVEEGIDAVFARHASVAARMRGAFGAMGLQSLSHAPANTITALLWPNGADGRALAAIRDRGVIVAGGLHPVVRSTYFRVGHMGAVTRDVDALRRTVEAVGEGLRAVGGEVDVAAGLAAFDGV